MPANSPTIYAKFAAFCCRGCVRFHCTTAIRKPHCRICLFSFGDLSDSRKKFCAFADNTRKTEKVLRNFQTITEKIKQALHRTWHFVSAVQKHTSQQHQDGDRKKQTKQVHQSEENKINTVKTEQFPKSCPFLAEYGQKLSARCAEFGAELVRQIDFCLSTRLNKAITGEHL